MLEVEAAEGRAVLQVWSSWIHTRPPTADDEGGAADGIFAGEKCSRMRESDAPPSLEAATCVALRKVHQDARHIGLFLA